MEFLGDLCWIGEICHVRLNKADCKTPTLQIMIYRWCCDFASLRVDLLGSSQLICLTAVVLGSPCFRRRSRGSLPKPALAQPGIHLDGSVIISSNCNCMINPVQTPFQFPHVNHQSDFCGRTIALRRPPCKSSILPHLAFYPFLPLTRCLLNWTASPQARFSAMRFQRLMTHPQKDVPNP